MGLPLYEAMLLRRAGVAGAGRGEDRSPMASHDILINWTPQETRVAIVENGAVQER